MRQVTRRFFRKSPALAAALLLGAVLLMGAYARAGRGAAVSTYVPAGDDRFETTDNGETYHNFGGNPIPAGFFNTDGLSTSYQYSGTVPLKGSPLPNQGDTDTIIRRNQAVYTPGTTSIQIVGLSLVGINPITVSYSDRPSELWSVRVGLSGVQPSTGTMTIRDGGTFDSTLSVYPKFTFTRLSDGAVKTLDTGASGGGALAASTVNNEYGTIDREEVLPAPCRATTTDTAAAAMSASDESTAAATTSSSCAPVTLTSTNSPWSTCNGQFCIPRPITEQELLASHNASPPGTIRRTVTATDTTAVR
jgi:hypothetical protein